jgi:hypothetical protein
VDPGCLSRITDPNFFIPDPGSRVKKIPGSRIKKIPGSRIRIRIRIRIKEFKYFYPKILFLSSGKYDSGMFIPDPDLDFLPILDPGSRGQKCTGFRIPDPQHWL